MQSSHNFSPKHQIPTISISSQWYPCHTVHGFNQPGRGGGGKYFCSSVFNHESNSYSEVIQHGRGEARFPGSNELLIHLNSKLKLRPCHLLLPHSQWQCFPPPQQRSSWYSQPATVLVLNCLQSLSGADSPSAWPTGYSQHSLAWHPIPGRRDAGSLSQSLSLLASTKKEQQQQLLPYKIDWRQLQLSKPLFSTVLFSSHVSSTLLIKKKSTVDHISKEIEGRPIKKHRIHLLHKQTHFLLTEKK